MERTGGRVNVTLVGLVLILAAVPPPHESAVPVEEEPYHKTVFKNDYVQAFRVTLEPGQTSLMHIHSHDDAAVRLSTATVAQDSPGQPLAPPEPVSPGFVSARDNEAKPLTHRVHNVGTTVFDVIDVQILKRPDGPATPAISLPAAENAKMRVYRYELEPGAATTRHAHTRPYLLVAATDADLRTISPGGASMEHPMKTGDMQWMESTVTHTLMNRGVKKAILVEFELK